ncbi:MAG TPA: rod shape-determining protein MreC [bacterium]|nr:rod shape-determining protein MreC [bacterium]
MRIKRSTFFLVVFFPLLFFILQNPQISQPVHAASLTVLKPVLEAGHTIAWTLSRMGETAVDFWRTYRQENLYKLQAAELESRLIQFEEIKKENERLKDLIDFKKNLPAKTVAARVIGSDLSPWRKTLVLDKGTSQGIKKDMIVMVPGGLVGRISEAGPRTSRALLLIDPDSRVSAMTDSARAQGVAAGDGSLYLTMKYLDLDSTVSVGENVLTSGMGGMFPKGIGIGRIESLTKDESGLHLSGQIRPFVNFSKLEEVLCLAFSRAE